MMNSTVLEFLISIIRYIRTILLFNHHSQRVSNCSVLCLSAKLSWNKTWTAQKYRVLQIEECFDQF